MGLLKVPIYVVESLDEFFIALAQTNEELGISVVGPHVALVVAIGTVLHAHLDIILGYRGVHSSVAMQYYAYFLPNLFITNISIVPKMYWCYSDKGFDRWVVFARRG